MWNEDRGRGQGELVIIKRVVAGTCTFDAERAQTFLWLLGGLLCFIFRQDQSHVEIPGGNLCTRGAQKFFRSLVIWVWDQQPIPEKSQGAAANPK